jgi:SAM-dependent methyltransferase
VGAEWRSAISAVCADTSAAGTGCEAQGGKRLRTERSKHGPRRVLSRGPRWESDPRGSARVIHWSEDQALWEAMEPALCAPGRLALADSDVASVVGVAQPRPASRVLDLACGPGAHALGFARLGHRVTGVDRSPRLLGRARAAAEAAAGAGFRRRDARRVADGATPYDESAQRLLVIARGPTRRGGGG